MSSAFRQLTICAEDDHLTINYLSQVACKENQYFHYLPWQSAVLTNIDEDGMLINFSDWDRNSTVLTGIKPFVLLTLKIFEWNQERFPVFICGECQEMKAMYSLDSCQNPRVIKPLMCIHSKIMGELTPDWQTRWNTQQEVITDGPEMKLLYPPHERVKQLAGLYYGKKVSLLYTLGKERRPYCDQCSTSNCKHYQFYVKVCDGGKQL